MGAMRLLLSGVLGGGGGRPAEIPAWSCMCLGKAERTWGFWGRGVEPWAWIGSEVDRAGCLRMETGPAGRDAEGPSGATGSIDEVSVVEVGAEATRAGPEGLDETVLGSGVDTLLPAGEDLELAGSWDSDCWEFSGWLECVKPP